MENFAYEQFILKEMLFEGDSEQNIESDILVPDYLPEVMKILRVDASPQITETSCQKGAVQVAGDVEICVMYIPEQGNGMKCLRYIAHFEKMIEIQGVNEKSILFASVTNKFINCRLLSSRKLNVSLGLIIHLCIHGEKEIKCMKGQPTDGIEMKIGTRKISSYVGSSKTKFSLEEELEIGVGKPAAVSIMKCDVQINDQQAKMISNKVITKATVFISYLYEGQGGTIETVRFELPVSHILELNGVDDDCICNISYDVLNKDFSILDNFEGEARTISTVIELCANAYAYRNEMISVVEDAYTTKYAGTLNKQNMTVERLCPEQHSEITIKNSVEAENGVTSVLDTVVSVFIPEVKCEGKRLFIHSTADVFILIRNGQNDLENIEKQMPVQFVIDMEESCENADARFVIEMMDISCNISGEDTIQIKLQLCAKGTVWLKEKTTVICDIDIDTGKVLPNKKGTLILYYPDGEESFWEIAKRYGASVQCIKEVNNCDGDCCVTSMLMIPRKI